MVVRKSGKGREKMYKLELTKEELLMVMDVMQERREAPHYDWQTRLMDAVQGKIESVYQKSAITEKEVEAKCKEIAEKWPEDKETGTFLANIERARLYFMYRVEPTC